MCCGALSGINFVIKYRSMKIKHCILVLVVIICAGAAFAQDKGPEFLQKPTPWTDSLMAKLSLDERIGQLFMVAAYSNKDAAHERELKALIEKHHLGGLIFFQGGPLRQAHMYNRLQKAAKVPLWIGIDGEWGLAMRLDSTTRFPYQMALGAIRNDSLVQAMGAEIGRQCKRMGIQINFAPVVDVNNNPANPVIGFRSFGESRENVSLKAAAYMRGLQSQRVLANAKHFPGHGDTDADSHLALPVIRHDLKRLQSVELYPFAQLFSQQVASVMVAHLHIPALDSTPNMASTLSSKVVNGLLKNDMKFKGLVFTDALNMKGVSNFHAPGDVEWLALKAGNDVLLFAEDVPKAAARIKQAIASGEYSEEQLNKSVRKILQAKEWSGVHRNHQVAIKNLAEDLNTPYALHLKKKLAEAAITIVQNKNSALPLRDLAGREIAVVTIGGNGTVFKNRLAKYARFDAVECSAAPTTAEKKQVTEALSKKNTVIVNVEGTNNTPGKNFGLTTAAIELMESLCADRQVILVHMGNPYALAKLRNPGGFAAIVVGYQNEANLSRSAAEAIIGAIPVSGRLPVSISTYYPVFTGVEIASAGRMYHTTPLEFGLAQTAFDRIDSLAILGLKQKAYPGCQVLAAKDGKVVYNKSFGFQTYDDADPVRSTDIYDLASITKIAASTISLMKLQDMGKFSLDNTLGTYFPEIPEENPYKQLILRRIMAHVAGLPAWVPFYQATIVKGEPRWDVYSRSQSDIYSLRVAHGMYISKVVSDSLLYKILTTPLREDDSYKYSDVGYYFVREIIRRQSGESIDVFAEKNFYKPLGINTMGYHPLDRYPRERIMPTEYDNSFRKQLIRGDVHDPGAAMQGGVGGHAGLFSNAEDLAVLMQMLINGGTYGGERYLDAQTVKEYTDCQFCTSEVDENRRGAGFDKPFLREGPGPTCKCVTFDSFGHTGFTGTIVWADPVENIVYVFLSNRVYPTAENNKLAKLDIRTLIQAEIYKVLKPVQGSLGMKSNM